MHKHDPYGDASHQNNVTTFLSAFNLGEVQKYNFNNKQYAKISFRGQVIWDSRNDKLRVNNYERLCKK